MLALLAVGHAQLQGCEVVRRQRLLLHRGGVRASALLQGNLQLLLLLLAM